MIVPDTPHLIPPFSDLGSRRIKARELKGPLHVITANACRNKVVRLVGATSGLRFEVIDSEEDPSLEGLSVEIAIDAPKPISPENLLITGPPEAIRTGG